MRLIYPSHILSPTREIKILQKVYKDKKFRDRMIIKAIWGKPVNKQFKKLHFRKIGV